MRSGKRKGQQDIKENINSKVIIMDVVKASDEGGEDWSSCSPARPRGCVECVA